MSTQFGLVMLVIAFLDLSSAGVKDYKYYWTWHSAARQSQLRPRALQKMERGVYVALDLQQFV